MVFYLILKRKEKMTETTQTQTETVKETLVQSEPAESVAGTDSGVSSDVEQGEATASDASTVEVSDGETSVAVSADDPVALTVAVVLGLLVVAGLAVKKLLNK
jgi:hypothetical protein